MGYLRNFVLKNKKNLKNFERAKPDKTLFSRKGKKSKKNLILETLSNTANNNNTH